MRVLVLATVFLLAACGNKGDLKPAVGDSLPPKPYGAVATPTARDLVEPSPQTRPTRSDEVLRNSEERRSDEFDLPPQN